MKRILAVLLLALSVVVSSFAEDTKPIWDKGDNVSDISYTNVRIYKVLDQLDSYIVLYEKGGVGIGQAVLPKKWFKESPRKLEFRTKPGNLNPYMTVIKKGGEFYKVWLTVPINRNNSAWGIAKSGTTVNGTDAETLDIEY